jgi:hypothetical protein
MNEFNLIIKPDEDEPDGAEVYVDGTIGTNPYRFLLDTGAGRSSVIFDAYTATFSGTEKHHSSGVFAKHSEDLITIPNLDVGPISKADVTLTRTAEGNTMVRSLIGMDLLHDLRLHFLFDENRVVVDNDYQFGSEDPVQDLFLDKAYHPYVDVQFGPLTAKSVWDTGASITIADSTFISHHPSLFREVGSSSGIDSTGATVQTPMYLMAECQIGGSFFPPVRVAAVDLSGANATLEVPMNLILGYSTMSKANWLFDFPNRKWAITKWLGARR